MCVGESNLNEHYHISLVWERWKPLEKINYLPLRLGREEAQSAPRWDSALRGFGAAWAPIKNRSVMVQARSVVFGCFNFGFVVFKLRILKLRKFIIIIIEIKLSLISYGSQKNLNCLIYIVWYSSQPKIRVNWVQSLCYCLVSNLKIFELGIARLD